MSGRLLAALAIIAIMIAGGLPRLIDARVLLHPAAGAEQCVCCEHEGIPASASCVAACQPATMPAAPFPAAAPSAPRCKPAEVALLRGVPSRPSTPPPRRPVDSD